MPLEVTVDRVTDEGHVVVHVTKSMGGLIQAHHATDSAAGKKPKVKAGEKLKARVLEVDVAERRLRLTLRKALLMSKQAPLVSLEQAARGEEEGRGGAERSGAGACPLWGFLGEQEGKWKGHRPPCACVCACTIAISGWVSRMLLCSHAAAGLGQAAASNHARPGEQSRSWAEARACMHVTRRMHVCAAAGAKFHGMVTGVTPKGVFVSFYAGLSGLAPPSELGLAQGQSAGEVYKVGMVSSARQAGCVHGRPGKPHMPVLCTSQASCWLHAQACLCNGEGGQHHGPHAHAQLCRSLLASANQCHSSVPRISATHRCHSSVQLTN